MTETPYALGRNVCHDPRSLLYPYDTAGAKPVSARHNRDIPVLDQGDTGSCTGNASAGALGSDPFFTTLPKGVTLDEDYARDVIYSLATQLDSYPGSFPPEDTGSNGVSVAAACKRLGLISGYTHSFDLNTALVGFGKQPGIIGISWYNNFFSPDSKGFVSIAKDDEVAGGHEIVVDEINVEQGYLGLTNSWGTSWGVDGRFFMTFKLFERLLGEEGDVTFFVPLSQPAPTPVPPTPHPVPPAPDPADSSCWKHMKAWAKAKGL